MKVRNEVVEGGKKVVLTDYMHGFASSLEWRA